MVTEITFFSMNRQPEVRFSETDAAIISPHIKRKAPCLHKRLHQNEYSMVFSAGVTQTCGTRRRAV
jgi:hypothetical protein